MAHALGLEAPTRAEHTALFQLELPPYASLYLGDAPVVGGDARDRVAGFWRALGVTPPAEPDHLAALLGFYAALCESRVPGEARRALLWEHLLSWLPAYAAKVREIAPPPLRAWAELLARCLTDDAMRYPADGLVPLHLRSAAEMSDPRRDGLAPFLDALLAPLRSGLILTRDDFSRAALDTELAVRISERRSMASALLAQDATSVLRWLAMEARRFSTVMELNTEAFAPASSYWSHRARTTAVLLDALAADAWAAESAGEFAGRTADRTE